MSTNLFDAQNAGYVQSLYELYARNPEAVPEAWRRFFAQGPAETQRAGLYVPEGLSTNGHGANGHGSNGATATVSTPASRAASAQAEGMDGAKLTRLLGAVAGATSFVQAFRDHGHMLAQIDPLGSKAPGHPQLVPTFHDITMDDLEQIQAGVVMDEGALPGET